MSWCGSRSMSCRSLQVPGSLSSALATTKRGKTPAGIRLHLRAVGKKAPPRPRRLARDTSSDTWEGAISRSALRNAV